MAPNITEKYNFIEKNHFFKTTIFLHKIEQFEELCRNFLGQIGFGRNFGNGWLILDLN